MALPLPKVVRDIGPGGFITDYQEARNALANKRDIARYNKSKADWANTTIPAQAISQLAYANAIGPQFIAKLLQNKGALAQMPEEQRQTLLEMVKEYGMTEANKTNPLNNLPQNSGISHEPSTNNFGGTIKNAFLDLLGLNPKPQTNNSLRPSTQGPNQEGNRLPMPFGNNEIPQERPVSPLPSKRPKGAVELVGAQWYDKKGNPVYGDEEVRESNGKPLELEVNEGNRAAVQQKSWQDNQADFESTIEEAKSAAKERGKIREQNIGDIGKDLDVLSTTGASIDRLINGFTNPEFMKLRETIPFFQDKQLSLLKATGSPLQRHMVGTLVADIEAFKGATINSFKGQTLKREFEYADKLKPSESDTVYTALGKLQALKSLKEIAWQKKLLIKDYLQKDKMSLADAIVKANKQVDIKKIDKEVQNLTAPRIRLRNREDKSWLYLTPARLEELRNENG